MLRTAEVRAVRKHLKAENELLRQQDEMFRAG